jgi:hypothetical protein
MRRLFLFAGMLAIALGDPYRCARTGPLSVASGADYCVDPGCVIA